MPLKHSTETTLVVVLGLAMALAGVAVAVLSLVSAPWLLWIAAFFISLAYPLVLYPHFRERRADYEFRILHFAPAFVLLTWLVLTVLAPLVPLLAFLRTILMFGWALPLVTLGFLLLTWFCLTVIRQWTRRLGGLALVFVPFMALALFGQSMEWNPWLAALLEPVSGSGSVSSGPIAVGSAKSGVSIMSRGMSRSSAVAMGSSSSKPPHLPHAGPEDFAFLAVMVPAATSAAVHLRAMRRQRA